MGRIAAILSILTLLTLPLSAPAAVLVGNTASNNVVLVDTVQGKVLRDFIAAGSGGLVSPDDLNYGPDGNLYVSSGTNTSGAILRYDGRTGDFIDVFATSDSLRRPYGFAFGPDGLLYVASFRSDEILRYDAVTGAFVDVFASGDGTAGGLLNGPNDLLFDRDGRLYVTTQGSVANPDGSVSFSQASQLLRYDIATGAGELLAQPTPSVPFFGFVSLLGLALGADGAIWTSDFANGVRVYDPDSGALLSEIDTNYTGTIPSNNFIGNLAFVDGDLAVVGFDLTQGNIGALLRFDALTGAPLPGTGLSGSLLVGPDPLLNRPIGIVDVTFVRVPAAGLLLAGGLFLLALRARRRA